MSTDVYFDLDGTLTDPYEGISKCIVYAVEQLGFARPSDAFLTSCIGPPLYESLPKIVGAENTLKAVDLYRERFDDTGWGENVPYAGIHDALEKVSAAGHRLFVATSKPRVAAQRIIEHFEFSRFFERVFGCELDGTHANKVDLLEFAVLQNREPVNRLMIGDRKHDIHGAIANNICPLGVAYGYGSVAELEAAGSKAIAATPAELPELIELHIDVLNS